jgi:hypothetical protein
MYDPASRFRSGFDILLETTPNPPEFDDIAVSTLGADRSSRSRVWLFAAAVVAVVVLMGGIGFFTQPDSGPVLSRADITPASDTPGTTPAEVAGPLFGEELPWTLIFDDGLSGVVVVDLNDPVERRVDLDGQRPGDQPYRLGLVSQYLITGWGGVFAEDLNDLHTIALGSATIWVPAAETDRVWLIEYAGGRIGQGDPLVWQVFPSGARASEPVTVDYDGLPAIGIPGGLALETDHGVALWDADSGAVTDVLGSGTGFVSDSSSDGNLAWCEDTCEVLHVTNVLTGEDMTITRPNPVAPEAPSFGARAARFANDHRFLASLSGNDVLVTDLQTGVTEVRITGDKPYEFLGWDPFGPELFASTYAYGQNEVDVAHVHATGGEAQKATVPYGGTLGFQVVDTEQARWLLSDLEHNGCPWTEPEDDPFVPPSPYPAEPSEGFFWYGTDALWTALPVDGNYGERKSVWWSVDFPGGGAEETPDIRVEWRAKGLATPVRTSQGPGTNAYTDADGWLMIADGFDPRTPGCWEVTATYKGATLSYVYYLPNPD